MKKKLLLGLFFSIALLAGVSMAHAETQEDIANKVFKIQAYSYNKLFDMYSLEQYGSAVLIAKNILLTNAHVITDYNGELTLQYEACQTVSDQDPPVCFSSLQLLSYDKDADLALLQIMNPTDDMPDPVILGSGTLAVGDAIHIIGYPANGGETITTTQGTIAGFENGYYKTDANVDEGNSGGGGFDSGDNFVGIPTFVVNGMTTLGYLIPISTIQDFIAGKSGTTYKVKASIIFDKWLKKIYALQKAGKIENTLFSTSDLDGLGLQVTSLIEKPANNLYAYVLEDEHGNQIQINSLIATDSAAINKYVNDSMKQFTDSDFTVQKKVIKIGSISRNKILFGDDSTVGYDYIQTNGANKSYLEICIFVDKENAADLSGLVQFVESIALKRSIPKPQVLNIPSIKLSSKWGVGIVKRMNDDGLSVNLFPDGEKFTVKITAYPAEKSDTLKQVIKSIMSNLTYLGLDATKEAAKYSSVSIISVLDEDENETLNILGIKNYGGSNIFLNFAIPLKSSSAKQDAINLVYRILGLE
ncbi:MAG: serine protease [Candidatus Absconditabacterales bacterium]